MTNTEKFPYEAPTLESVGNLHEITKAGSSPNRDGPNAQNDTAFPPIS